MDSIIAGGKGVSGKCRERTGSKRLIPFEHFFDSDGGTMDLGSVCHNEQGRKCFHHMSPFGRRGLNLLNVLAEQPLFLS
jgi:hypothetical protein